MIDELLIQASRRHMQKLCVEISDRSVCSDGNREACRYFQHEVTSHRWHVELQEFEAIDWEQGGATLSIGDESFDVHVSPYSLGCSVVAKLVRVSSIAELEQMSMDNKILVLHGSIAIEQLMPKGFVFYNPEEHQKIIRLLEEDSPAAIICITGRNAALAGGLYPFPLIEDGDFDIPSVYMTEEEGARLLSRGGAVAVLNSVSKRIPGNGVNVVARTDNKPKSGEVKKTGERIVITAHIDAKKGTPGAIDNATGVTVLLLLSQLLSGYNASPRIELVALNGEDYFSVPGQMQYIADNQNSFDEILLNINIDGAGYDMGDSAYSLYNLERELETIVKASLAGAKGVVEGVQWPQGDHSIFVQYGRPAIAFSSKWFTEHIDAQEITHTPKDHIGIVNHQKIVDIVKAIEQVIRSIDTTN